MLKTSEDVGSEKYSFAEIKNSMNSKDGIKDPDLCDFAEKINYIFDDTTKSFTRPRNAFLLHNKNDNKISIDVDDKNKENKFQLITERIIFEWFKTDKISLIIFILGAISGFFLLSSLLPEILSNLKEIFAFFPIKTASAATATSNNQIGVTDKNQLISNIFTLSCILAFFWAFAVSLHDKSPSKRQNAKNFVNLFAGILVGSAKSTLGL